MSKFVFTDPDTGQEFVINAPQGTSVEQARAIFRQQLNTGSLVGLGVGSVISAATQAASGLASAQAMANQTLGSSPAASLLNTISSTLGPAALAAVPQVVNSLLGPGASIASNAVGSASAAAAEAVRTASNLTSTVGSTSSRLGPSAAGIGTTTSSLAAGTVVTLTRTLNSSVTNGINTADLVKQGTVSALPELSATDTQAALSQAAKLVGQPPSVVTNNLGVGKFGFDLSQLETAGYIKPGLAATASRTGASVSSVLSSPLAFTGKDGVKSLDQILSNEILQNNIQQSLMSVGLSTLRTQGVPVNSLNPQAIAGLANNAAKSVENTISSIRGTAPSNIKSRFDIVARDSAYAVDYAKTKVPPQALGQVPVETAEATVNTATVDAAGGRIIGNNKVFAV